MVRKNEFESISHIDNLLRGSCSEDRWACLRNTVIRETIVSITEGCKAGWAVPVQVFEIYGIDDFCRVLEVLMIPRKRECEGDLYFLPCQAPSPRHPCDASSSSSLGLDSNISSYISSIAT